VRVREQEFTMKIWIERALAALRWVWDRLAPALRWVVDRAKVVGNTVYDPPPKTIRFWFWSWAALMLVAWLTFAFTNSWFYRPTVEFFATLGDDGDVFIPDHIEPLPPVATPAVTVPSVEVVCHDMSDTPHCEPVQVPSEKSTEGTQIKADVNSIPPPVAKSREGYKTKKSPVGYKRRKHQPYQTYWGF
jgi:hypothetical protein